MRSYLAFLIAYLFSPGISFAQLKAGDISPNLQITHWIQNIPANTSLDGKFLVIDFWATWCAPCLASMPHMNDLISENKNNKHLLFLALSDEESERILPMLKRVKISAVIVSDTTQKTQKQFKIQSLPYSVVIDDKKQIKWAGDPAELTNDVLQNILKRKNIPSENDEASEKDMALQVYTPITKNYYNVYADNSIDEYFDLGGFSAKKYGSTMNANSLNSVAQINIGVNTQQALANLMGVSPVQIVLPANLENSYVSYCYKSKTKIKNTDILNAILNKADLKYETSNELQDVIILQVSDTTRLYHDIANESDRISRLSESEKYVYLKNDIFTKIIPVLENKFKCPVIIKGPEIYNKKINIMLEINSFKDLQASMDIYGVKAFRGKENLPKYIIKPI